MNPLLVLAGLGILGYVVLSKSSSTPALAAPTAAQLANAPGAYGPNNPIAPPNPAAYGLNPDGTPIVANGTTPGSLATNTSTSGPLFHTGQSCARTGAPLVVDGGGNPYLLV